ncbi:metallophosphoesterase family protein, partial [Oceanicola sp. S124]|uniref:metallophosphoesterase family protein n=1 Tax=Oceanicola sp. S124 TaxID=1042378 RepID=UPI0002557EAC
QIHALAPDLVVISGDFTQRARERQFLRARDFLARIGLPVLSVPGNHDTPLDNLLVRFLAPFRRYRRHICAETEPFFTDGAMSVVGVNTVNPFSWQTGRFRRSARRRVCWLFEEHPAPLRIVALHHPLEHGPETGKKPMRGARSALNELADCGAQVVLSGHLHRASSGPVRAAPGLLLVEAGTGLSTRQRGEENTFNLLDWEAGGALRVTTWSAQHRAGRLVFAPSRAALFRQDEGAWLRVGPAPEAQAWGQLRAV